MFTVEITDEARTALEAQLRDYGYPNSGVTIAREGPSGDVSRSNDGSTVWKIERPANAWRLDIGSFEQHREGDYQVVNGIRVYLAIIPRDGERGVVVRLVNGRPTVEPLGT